MQKAGMILGIIGGIIGLFSAAGVMFFGGLGAAIETEGATGVIGLGWGAFFSSIVGIIGGALASSKTKAAAILCLIAGISGIIFVSAGYIVAGPLLIIAGILLLIASRASARTT